MSTSERRLTVPDDLESPQSKLVYLTLLWTEEATASELQQRLGLPKLTLLSVLELLVQQDLVRRTENGYACQ